MIHRPPEGNSGHIDPFLLICGIHGKIKHFIALSLLLVFCLLCRITSVIIAACSNVQLCNLHIAYNLTVGFNRALHFRKRRIVYSVMSLHTHGTDSGALTWFPFSFLYRL